MTNINNYRKAVEYYTKKLANDEDRFFKNRQSKLIYYLNRLTSAADIMNKLNLTKEIISDKYKLKEWVDMVYEIITTDISEHMINEANLAIKNLKILYIRLNK